MKVYLDNAATTKVDPRVLVKMKPYFSNKYMNPSSIHLEGQALFLELEKAREKIAEILCIESKGIVFTSSATEANNLIIKGLAKANRKGNRKKILVSEIEHPCVLESVKEMSEYGFEVVYLKTNSRGIISQKELESKIDNNTLLVSVMAVNNEIGTINNIKELADISHKKGAYFHSDAVQAVPYIELSGKKMNFDFLSISAHKFHGPKGVGMAYIKPGIKIEPLITGGGQENNLRAGTYNLPGIIGMTHALELAYRERKESIERIRKLRDYLLKSIKKDIKGVSVNGCIRSRVAANLNIMFGSVEGEAILMDLAYKGISVSTGSACSASNLKSSYVLSAIGLKNYNLNSNIRFSFSKFNNKKEIDYLIKSIKETVKRLRSFSPVK